MNLENLQDMWRSDSKLDEDLHDNDSLAIPQLHMKYMEFHNKYSLMKKERDIEMKRLIREKWLYYKGKAPSSVYKEMPFDLKLTTKEEISMFIEADEDIGKLKYKIEYIDQVLFFLDGVLRMINNRTYISKTLLNGRNFKVVFNNELWKLLQGSILQQTINQRSKKSIITRFKIY
tara:strand:+ start:713 stop:1237 length:525 start_codon:yes stop_codon:yes gene_type:complete